MAIVGVLIAPRAASADPSWIERRLTLSQGEWGLNLGMGLADDARDGVVGTGVYEEIHYGITDRIELSARDGISFGIYGQWARASQYARLYSTDGATSPGPAEVSNPDLLVVGRFVDFGWLELAGQAALTFPAEPGTSVAPSLGVAAVFHTLPWLRVDTGAYGSVAFASPLIWSYELPLQVWFQPFTVPVWFGPLTALRHLVASRVWTVPVGVGAGYAVTDDIDVRFEILVPEENVAPQFKDLGGGVGGQIRF